VFPIADRPADVSAVHRPSLRRLTVALATSVVAVLGCTAGPAAASEDQITIDVLKVVDGEYVVETVTAPRDRATATEQTLEDRTDVVAAGVAVDHQLDAGPDPAWQTDDPQAVSRVRDVWPRTRGAGQVVAVLDTAVDGSHPDLAGALLPGTDTSGFPAYSDESHGTGVAGVIAARADNGEGSAGMAPEARILPVRVCTNAACPSAAIARGILWAADHGADVINLSLSGGYSDVIATAVRYALDKDISVVASAGNSGQQGNAVLYPAALEGVIAVSATTPSAAPAPWAQHGWQVDVSTVGESVLLAGPDGGYVSGDGTSFSGPAVAGAAALLRASHPGITAGQVQAALQAGAESGSTWDRRYGAGRLDVPAAVAAADRAGTALTVTPSPGAVDVSWPAVPGAAGYSVRVDGVVRVTVPGTSARVAGLTDGTQVAVDVQPDHGERSVPALATVGTGGPAAPTLHSATLTGSGNSALLNVSVSVSGPVAPRYSLLKDGVSVGTYGVQLTGSPQTFAFGVTMPTHEARWQLRGMDDLGRVSDASNAVVTGSGRPAAPAAPTGLFARADSDRVLLSWDDLGTAHTYTVSVGGSVVASPHTAGSALPAEPGVARTYSVAVVDAWGQSGPTSSVTVTASGASVPGRPTSVTTARGDRSATVSWTAADPNGSPVTGYTVTVAPDGATVSTTGATTATLTGLTNGRWYSITVTATNAVGTGPTSATVYEVPAGVPGAVGAVAVTANDGGVTLRWEPPEDNGSPITTYTVTASPGGARVTAGGPWAWFAPLINGTAYTFTVSATNGAGTGPASAPTVPVAPIGPPPSAITLVWQASGGYSGTLGHPFGGDRCGLRNGGCFRIFERGWVYWSPATGAHVVSGTVLDRWASQGWEGGPLGYPVSDTTCGLADGGCYQHFQGGTVMSSPATGAWPLTGTLRDGWVRTGSEGGALGYPISAALCGLRDGGCLQRFAKGTLYSSPATGARAVIGPTGEAWARQGWETGALGYPVTDTTCGLARGGCYQHFQGGTVMYSPANGSWGVTGVLRDGWFRTGSEGGALGYPTNAPICGLRDGGCFQRFETGALYWSPASGARAVSGGAAVGWARQGWENGPLGYPVTDTGCGLRDAGCFQHFQGGTVMSSPAHGSWALSGPLRDGWFRTGFEGGVLGYPAAAAVCGLRDGGCFQRFERGSLYWSSATGAHPVRPGRVGDTWAALGWEWGLGYPLEEERPVPGGSAQRYRFGTLTWDSATDELRRS
jgi:uncharacterized protein with LGFP repeats